MNPPQNGLPWSENYMFCLGESSSVLPFSKRPGGSIFFFFAGPDALMLALHPGAHGSLSRREGIQGLPVPPPSHTSSHSAGPLPLPASPASAPKQQSPRSVNIRFILFCTKISLAKTDATVIDRWIRRSRESEKEACKTTTKIYASFVCGTHVCAEKVRKQQNRSLRGKARLHGVKGQELLTKASTTPQVRKCTVVVDYVITFKVSFIFQPHVLAERQGAEWDLHSWRK